MNLLLLGGLVGEHRSYLVSFQVAHAECMRGPLHAAKELPVERVVMIKHNDNITEMVATLLQDFFQRIVTSYLASKVSKIHRLMRMIVVRSSFRDAYLGLT